MAEAGWHTVNATAKAFASAYMMLDKHTNTEMKRKNRAILFIFNTYREFLEIDGDKLYAVVEGDYITQPLRVADDARLVAS